MSGYFALGSGLLGDGFFIGMVDTARRIEFTVPGVFGNGPLHFSGIVQADGSLKGGYWGLVRIDASCKILTPTTCDIRP